MAGTGKEIEKGTADIVGRSHASDLGEANRSDKGAFPFSMIEAFTQKSALLPMFRSRAPGGQDRDRIS
jgi:hypothetical protein